MSSYNSAGYKESIWTDNEQARYVLWDNYLGFCSNYNDFLMYKSLGRNNVVLRCALIKYSVAFYEEIRTMALVFCDDLEDKANGITLDNFEEIFVKPEIFLFERNNLLLVRRFFEKFMFVSGIKNILFKKDIRDGIAKVKDKYKLK